MKPAKFHRHFQLSNSLMLRSITNHLPHLAIHCRPRKHFYEKATTHTKMNCFKRVSKRDFKLTG